MAPVAMKEQSNGQVRIISICLFFTFFSFSSYSFYFVYVGYIINVRIYYIGSRIGFYLFQILLHLLENVPLNLNKDDISMYIYPTL